MKTVKAARIQNYGGPEVVQVENISLPEPQSGELVIRNYASGVNPIDWKVRAGYLQQMMPLPLPFTSGSDFSGVVVAVGADVVDFKVGDAVYGQSGVLNGGSGSFAEFSVAKAVTIATKPRSVDHVEAGGLPLAGVSALQALTEHLCLSAGQKVLIHGGAGGIGGIAIQLAKHLGAHVATTASAEDLDYVKNLGADEVVDYRNQRFEAVLGGLDAVFDTVGGETYARSFRVLKRGGRLVSMLEQPNQELLNDFGITAVAQFTQVNTERLGKLAELVDRNVLKVHVDKTFPLERAAAALLHVETKSPRGKVVITIF
jgi:NADPH:quinone reductase-like Zn-dependent oxidoreductase